MILTDVAQVMIGVLTKREIYENGQNSYSVFSIKNYDENKEYDKISTQRNLNNKLAENGDLLFRLLYPNRIIYVDEKLEGLLIPSQFCIIRTDKRKMNPIVLKWYLESQQAKELLDLKVTGSIIKSMPVSSLKTLKVPDIKIEKQTQMENLINLWEEEKNVTYEILKEKEKLYDYYLKEMSNNNL